ncbi:MAG TPA: FAD-dependent oxidoreductase [Polyangiaceae bacterium]|jgi:uncharacterized protein with NAD-binding domain and iron-sulfur cluster|nr:FAD-dependent oxidoreductase [Polyangiaceae bacterium]
MVKGQKTRVVVLGAGPAGLAAAFGLSDTEEQRARYDVTVYQMGWRAGGKCSTGRAAPTLRVEQNGTHYLFGCYDACFDTVRRSFDELSIRGISSFGTYEQAFLPRNLLVFTHRFRGKWHLWPIRFPGNSTVPGMRDGALPFHDYVSMALGALVELFAGFQALDKVGAKSPFEEGFGKKTVVGRFIAPLENLADESMRVLFDMLSDLLAKLTSKANSQAHEDTLLALVSASLKRLRNLFYRMFSRRIDADLGWNRFFMQLDFGCTNIIGIIDDQVAKPGRLGLLDAIEYREWLRSHGAREVTLNAPFLNTWYDAVAAYVEGDKERPNLSAAVTLNSLLRSVLTYKGAFAYQMTSEIGDSFVAPIFQAVRERGVKFQFFQRVKDVVPDEQGRIVRLVMEQQVAMRNGDPSSYDPFIEVKGMKAWPDEPRWDQLELSAEQRPADLESFYTTWRGSNHELSVGEHFDIVILALPVGVLRAHCPRVLEQQPTWRDMVGALRAVETQSLRLWFRPDLKGLGWPYEPPIVSGYAKPFSTWEDDSHLATREDWPPGTAPGALASVFGALAAKWPPPGPDDAGYPARQKAAMMANARRWLDTSAGDLWPGIASATNPHGIDFDQLVDFENRKGEARLGFQTFKANAGPIEAYTMATAGTLRYRLRTDESGYENMYLAGDWVRNGVGIGSVEGAVVSGLQASRAVSGHPAMIPNENREL